MRHLAVFNLDLHEATDLSSADGAFVSLHPHDLRALNAQTHVSAGQHNSVLSGRVANHTLPLSLISDVRSVVVYPIDIIQVENSVIV